jgi:LmbE family N-acetylglucosaminyl deacetylase
MRLLTVYAHPDDESFVLSALRERRPDAVFTFGPAGITRHPDHIAVHRATLAAFHAVGSRGALFYDAVPRQSASHMGIADELDGHPNTFIDVTEFQHVKLQALAIHARYVVDARDRLEQLGREPLPIEPLHRAWPPVPDGAQVHTI